MQSLKLHIVGFPYRKNIEGHVSEFLSDAPGHGMTLRPQRNNEVDVHAIRAYDWEGRHVGFVSSAELSAAWGALQATGRKSLRGTIVSSNIEHPCAIFECMVPDDYTPAVELYPQKPFTEWTYSGPMLDFPEELDALDYMMDEIDDRLYEQHDWSKDDLHNFILLLERFTHESIYDISSETNDYRRRLLTRLRDTKIQALQTLADELNMMSGRTGRETSGGCVLDFWTRVIASEEMRKSLMVHQHQYDAEKVEEELKLFPDCMYYEWLRDRQHFVSKLFYKHIPREVLWRFVSGIAFVEMKKAIDLTKQAKEKEEADRQHVNVIMTGQNASYIENHQ